MTTLGCYETSSAQRRLFTLQQLHPHSTAYNLPAVFSIEGHLDAKKLEQALHKLVHRHESLRTIFETDLEHNEIVQVVLDDIHIALQYIELHDQDLKDVLAASVKPFSLEKAPLFRVSLLDTTAHKRYLFFDIHHIIADGISIQNIMKEIVCLYNDIPLPPVDVQYVDYVMWQNDLFANGDMDIQEQYWLTQLGGELPVLELPSDYARPVVRSEEGHTLHFELQSDTVVKLRQLVRQEGATLFMALLGIYSSLLQKYTGQNDMIIGTPIAGRRSTELESVIGMFVNTLALRVLPDDTMTFRQLLQQVKQTTLSAYDHQDYPLDLLLEKLNIPRIAGRNPVFDTMFVLQNMSMSEVEFNGLRFTPYEQDQRSSKFDISLEITEDDDRLTGKLEYSSELFAAETMERFVVHLLRIADQLVNEPDLPLHTHQLLDKEEWNTLIHNFNDHASSYPWSTIDRVFEEQATMYAERTAIYFQGETLTYRQLNDRANSLARSLQSKGVQPGAAVGIMAERSLELMVALLAVSKAGGAYVPIEPDYPQERIQHMLEDSGARWLLVQGTEALQELKHLERIDLLDESHYSADTSNLNIESDPERTAIIIFTSGTTGRPKGIMIKHKGIVRLVKHTNYVMLDEDTRMLQTCALGFDIFTFETWAPLLHGGALYLTEKSTYLDPIRLKPFLIEHNINIMVPTTALFNHLISEDQTLFNSLNTLIVAGEAMSAPHAQLLMKQQAGVTLINGYGPAESTSYTTAYRVTESDTSYVPIGKPISNTTCYVVDTHNQPVPIGVVGELLIGGEGIAGGYANRADLTAEKFIELPLLEAGILYRTGDLVKWRADGNLVYIGRRDHQVKIRGYRIELDEIKQQMLKLSTIREAAIVPIEQSGQETRICAYYTSSGTPDPSELRAELQQKLPEFMVPQLYVQLEHMPMSANHKIDMKALPDPELSVATTTSNEQRAMDSLETVIGQVWSEVLGIGDIGLDDPFFTLGGHSLKAVLIIAKLRKALGIEMGMEDIFNKPTIREMAEVLRDRQQEQIIEPYRVETRPFYPATSQQGRLFIVEKMKRIADTSNNITDIQRISGYLNLDEFRRVGQQLMERHEVLRLSHQLVNGEVVFKLHSELDFPLECLEGSEEEVPQLIRQFIRPHDLEQAPLFRVGLIRIQADMHILIFDIHHSIADGFSLGLLSKEFMDLLEGKELPALPFRYRDYAVWQHSIKEAGNWDKQEKYWLDVLQGDIPVLDMPLDYPRPAEQSFEGDVYYFTLKRELNERLQQMAMESSTTLYMLLLTAYFATLHHYSGDEDILIGTPVAGRNQAEFQGIIGMFVNTIILRGRPESHKTFEQLLLEVRHTMLGAFDHQDYPFELLLEKLTIEPAADRNPLFQTIFVLQNMDIPALHSTGLDFQPYLHEQQTNIIDISLIMTEEKGELQGVFEYGIRLFKQETVAHMAVHFEELLEALAQEGLNCTLAHLQQRLQPEKNHDDQAPVWLNDTFSF